MYYKFITYTIGNLSESPEGPEPAAPGAAPAIQAKSAGFSDLFSAPSDPDLAMDIPISLSMESLMSQGGIFAFVERFCLKYKNWVFQSFTQLSVKI